MARRAAARSLVQELVAVEEARVADKAVAMGEVALVTVAVGKEKGVAKRTRGVRERVRVAAVREDEARAKAKAKAKKEPAMAVEAKAMEVVAMGWANMGVVTAAVETARVVAERAKVEAVSAKVAAETATAVEGKAMGEAKAGATEAGTEVVRAELMATVDTGKVVTVAAEAAEPAAGSISAPPVAEDSNVRHSASCSWHGGSDEKSRGLESFGNSHVRACLRARLDEKSHAFKRPSLASARVAGPRRTIPPTVEVS